MIKFILINLILIVIFDLNVFLNFCLNIILIIVIVNGSIIVGFKFKMYCIIFNNIVFFFYNVNFYIFL